MCHLHVQEVVNSHFITIFHKYLTLQTWKESDEPGAERGER